MTAPVAGAVKGRPSTARLNARIEAAMARAERADVEMAARQHEASAFTVALRTVLRDLEAILLRPQYEYPVEALQETARLRGMTDRYARLWAEEPA